jgi:hypothetical protein
MWTYRYSCLGSPWQVTIINISRWTFVLRPAMNAVCLSTYKQHPSFEELPLTMLPVLSDQDMTGLVTRNFHPNHSVISSSYSWRFYGLSVHALIYRRAIRLLVDYASVIVCHYSKHQCSSVYLTLPVGGTFCYGVLHWLSIPPFMRRCIVLTQRYLTSALKAFATRSVFEKFFSTD